MWARLPENRGYPGAAERKKERERAEGKRKRERERERERERAEGCRGRENKRTDETGQQQHIWASCQCRQPPIL